MSSERRPLVLVGGIVAVAFALVWLVLRRGEPDEASAAPPADEPAAPIAERHLPPIPRTPPVAETKPYKEEVVTSDGVPIAPARGEVVGQAHPHPITPQHERIYGENRYVGAIEGAMEVKDAAGMRHLLDQYRREYPEDDQELQGGYAAIIDCIEHPGTGPRAAAARWLDTHNGSAAKRYVLRYCMDEP
jgi:hypothetical protein